MTLEFKLTFLTFSDISSLKRHVQIGLGRYCFEKVAAVDINTSYAMLSRGIPYNMPRVTCIFRIHTSLQAIAYTKKIQVTSGMFHGIPRESIA